MSVVVPVFNGMPHLEALTASLLAQTHRHLEIVFTEGGGTDSSIEYLTSLTDPRIRIVRMPTGTSAAENWTAASREANGEFAKLICQDDLLYPEAIAHQVADLQANSTALMAIARRDIIDATGKRLYASRGLAGVRAGIQPGADVIKASYLRGTNVIGEPLAVLFRTPALQEALPWRDENPLMLDLSMYARVAPRGQLVARMDSVGAFRVSNASWSTRLAASQIEQTKSWQREYAQNAEPAPTYSERLRAATGRHTQVNLRRAAYAVLRARGALDVGATVTPDPPSTRN